MIYSITELSNKMKNLKIALNYPKFSLLAALALALSMALTAPTLCQTKAEAEQALQSMTPSEIDQKLKELGITRDEAIQRAKALNINLDDYLSKIPSPARVARLLSSRIQQGSTGYRKRDRRRLLVQNENLSCRALKGGPAMRSFSPLATISFNTLLLHSNPSSMSRHRSRMSLGQGTRLSSRYRGETRLNLQLVVNRDGNILVPDVGPVIGERCVGAAVP